MRLIFLCLTTFAVAIAGCSTIEDNTRSGGRVSRGWNSFVDTIKHDPDQPEQIKPQPKTQQTKPQTAKPQNTNPATRVLTPPPTPEPAPAPAALRRAAIPDAPVPASAAVTPPPAPIPATNSSRDIAASLVPSARAKRDDSDSDKTTDTPEVKQLLADIAALPQIEQVKCDKIIGELRKIDATADPTFYRSMVAFARTTLLPKQPTTEIVSEREEKENTTNNSAAPPRLPVPSLTPPPPTTQPPTRHTPPEVTTAEAELPLAPAAPTPREVAHEIPIANFAVSPNTVAPSSIVPASYTAGTTSVPGRDDWKTPVAQAAETLRHRATSTDDEVRLRLLELALGRQQEAARAIDGVDAGTRAFWANEMLGLSVLLDEQTFPDPASRYAASIHHLARAQGGLRQHCPLKIQQMMFVEKWYGFGSYTPLSGEFNAGETASLYLELENMTVRESPLGFNTRSSSSYSLIDGAGTVVARAENIAAEETSQSRRRDSCLMIPIVIPKTISPGPYQIKLTVTDINHDKLQYAVEQISLRIRSFARSSDE